MQLTTDGLRVYLEAIEGAFGCDMDYAMLVKLYESTQAETRYSPAVCVSCERKAIMGSPDPKHISTSFVERQNLSMLMGMRRFTRLTNAFSKKIENHAYAVAPYYMHYNLVRRHQTLNASPAMEAGVTNRLWTIDDILDLVQPFVAGPRGPYRKRARMIDLTLDQFADKLERHLNGTEAGWDWDDFTSIRIKDKRLDRLRRKLPKYDALASQSRREEFAAIIVGIRRGEIPEIR